MTRIAPLMLCAAMALPTAVNALTLSAMPDFTPGIPPINAAFSNATAEEALMRISAQAGLPVLGDATPATASVSWNATGSLDTVLSQFSRLYGVDAHIAQGVIHLSLPTTRSLPVPSVVVDSQGIITVLRDMGVADARYDKSLEMLTFTANGDAYAKAAVFLQNALAGMRPIHVEIGILESHLSENNTVGIDWSKINIGTENNGVTLSSAASLMSPGPVTRTVLQSGNLSLDILAQSLTAQGKTSIVARPNLSGLPGRKMHLIVGNKRTYISGQQSTVTNGVVTTTTQTAESQSGPVIDVTASRIGTDVLLEMNVKLSELLNTAQVASGSGTITLPESIDRELQTTYRVKPGDVVVVGGLLSETLDKGSTKLFGFIPTGRSDKKNKVEYTVTIKVLPE